MSDNKKSNTTSCGAQSRYRNFACVLYPESAPENWRELLSGQFIPAFISPLHDKDVDPQEQPKKPHHHIVLMFDGKKSLEQARAVFDSIGGVGCEVVKSIRGYSRYLCHLDNPEKAQYAPEDVVSLCGADYVHTIGLAIDRLKAVDEMIDFIEENDISSYRQLVIYARSERRDWFRVLIESSTYVIKEYLKSREWELNRKEEAYD